VARKLADRIHLRLRFDERLRRRIEKAAEQNNQSMNAEIIARLEQSFSKEDVNEVIAKTADATVKAVARASRWPDRVFGDSIEEALARGDDLLATVLPWEMLIAWAMLHPEHPQAIGIMNRLQEAREQRKTRRKEEE
jgi:hypothetical protein